MLLYVLGSKGSSPGRQGFFMAVDEAGNMCGSIGGGIMEYKWVEMAKEMLEQPESTIHSQMVLRKQVHDKSGENQSGMICSGEQTILLYRCRTTDADTIGRLLISLNQHKNGTLTLSPDGLAFDDIPAPELYAYTCTSETAWKYVERTGYKNRLLIIGGGHCSQALSRLMRSMDFYIEVYDDRPGLKTLDENEAAHLKHIVGHYSLLNELIPGGDNVYIIIMTFGFRTDDIALRALLHTPCRYLGVLGSRSKMEKLMNSWREEGLDNSLLEKIHTPAGISINSRTPEEIAVSIAAEIIKIKNAG